MDDEAYQFGVPDGINETTLHPLGLAAILVFGCAMLVLPRRYAILPMILTACLIAPAQRVAIFTLDFTLLRIMIVFGVVRLFHRGEHQSVVWKPLDKVVVSWIASGVLLNVLYFGTMDAVTNRLGWAFDGLGMYFLFRCLVRDLTDLTQIAWGFVIVSVPVAIAFLIESRTGKNSFAFFGGVPAETVMRQGRLRCQGAFPHPILAGCFWANILPWIAALWWTGKRARIGAIVGIAASGIVILACASSTPISAVISGMIGGAAFALRKRMRWIRWALVVLLIILHFSISRGVWYIFAKIDFVGGSTGWARYYVLDLAIRNFSDWCLLGYDNVQTWTDGDYLDVVNQYVLEGLRGGFLTMALFISAIVVAFRGIGRAWRQVATDPARLAMCWAIGVSVFVHMMNFFAVSYFGQIIMLWYLTLAMAGTITPYQWVPRAVIAAPHVVPARRRTTMLG